MEKVSQKTTTTILLIMVVSSFYFIYLHQISDQTSGVFIYSFNSTDYILYNSKCRIPKVDPFNSEVKQYFKKENYVPCSKLDLLTYVEKNYDNTEAYLYINKDLVKLYTSDNVTCCLSEVIRGPQNTQEEKGIDNFINVSSCKDFISNIKLSENPAIVRCRSNFTKKEIYANAYASITTKKVEEKIKKQENSKKPLSVLMIGIDSISRLNMMRVMPTTRSYLESNDWIDMQAYNKIGDNTFPNLMGILTGRNSSSAYNSCDPVKEKALDKCNFVWYDYQKLGYITGYAEDESSISTFNYHKKGFFKEPVDYYFRPYIMAAEKFKHVVVDDMIYCTGPMSTSERILNAAKEFAITFKEHPNFGFFWLNFAHNKLNSASRMDFKIRNFLQSLEVGGVLENSMVIFLSDHGIRFGEILYTYTGWLEERLPMVYIWVPKWFQKSFPAEFNHLKLNSHKLTNPYDLHMTLQHILLLSGKNHTIKGSEACPNCESLFKKIPFERSCEDASIDQHWCTCAGFNYIDKDNITVINAAHHILTNISQNIDKEKEAKYCAKYKLKKVISSRISVNKDNWYKNDTYLLIILETSPKAIFEATLKINQSPSQGFTLENGISRLDYYKPHSYCVKSTYLKTLCYCHK